jgi:hypothetical protein
MLISGFYIAICNTPHKVPSELANLVKIGMTCPYPTLPDAIEHVIRRIKAAPALITKNVQGGLDLEADYSLASEGFLLVLFKYGEHCNNPGKQLEDACALTSVRYRPFGSFTGILKNDKWISDEILFPSAIPIVCELITKLLKHESQNIELIGYLVAPKISLITPNSQLSGSFTFLQKELQFESNGSHTQP